MALISCKDCGQKFSTDARYCPHCGAHKPGGFFRALLFWGFVLFAGIAIFNNDPPKKVTANKVPALVSRINQQSIGQACLLESIRDGERYLDTMARCGDAMSAAIPECNKSKDQLNGMYGAFRGIVVDKSCFDVIISKYPLALKAAKGEISDVAYQQDLYDVNDALVQSAR